MPDGVGFVEDTEPFRRELLAHCYRMLGSIQDAEDLVQETYLRAWRSYGGFEGRSSVRTWLYQIATNGCLTELAKRSRRTLPSGLYDPEPDPGAHPEDAGTEVNWLQPAPDATVIPDSADPAVIVAAREGLRLALIASLQYLPPKQRAILVLRDVLAFPATEVAVMLGTTTVSVKSALQRARARLRELAPAAGQITEPTAPRARALLEDYITAFENADAAALERLLIEDATKEATPMRFWFAGIALPDDLTDPAGLERHLAVNLFGTYAVTRAFLPALTRSRGTIVNILSVNSLAPLPHIIPAYSISKAAAFSLTQSLRALLAAQGVKVHAVLPGPVDTDMTRGFTIPGKASPESVALAIFNAIDNGEEDIFPDPASAPMADGWSNSAAKALERQLAQLTPVSS